MSEATTTPTVTRDPSYLVYYRTSWSGSWIPTSYIYPISIQLSAGPSMSRAVLMNHYGTIKREDATAFAAEDPIDLKDTFIKIETVDDPGEPNTLTPIFYGFVPAEELRPHKATSQASGDHEMTAYGLDYLLDVSPVAETVAQDAAPIDPGNTGTPDPARITRVLPFNERYTYGLTPVGNRSENKFGTDTENNMPGSYVFSDDNKPWTARDICEYILNHFGDPRVTFTLSGQDAILNNVTPSNFNPDLMTPRQIINAMIDRRRGAGWKVKVTPSGQQGVPDTVNIEVFSLLGAAVMEGTIEIPANTSLITIDLDTLAKIDEVNLAIETTTKYDQIVVRGARVKTVFSMQKEQVGVGGEVSGGIIPAWTVAEQAAYDAADDNERDSDVHRHVYTTFTLPRNVQLFSTVNPKINPDGTPNFNVQGNMRSWGFTFLRQLPIAKEWSDPDIMPEFRDPFAFVKDPDSGRYHYADRLNTVNLPDMSIRMLDSQPGVELIGYYGHILGLNHFGGDSTRPALFDYEDMYITVACETDSHLFYRVDISGTVNNRLTIDVPDAELWILSKGTATDINTDGTLAIEPISSVLRSDADRLEGIAAVARAWYGVQRGSLNLHMKLIATFAELGDYITNSLSGNYSESVESVVSQITWDCLNARTTIQTAYEELDFQRLDR